MTTVIENSQKHKKALHSTFFTIIDTFKNYRVIIPLLFSIFGITGLEITQIIRKKDIIYISIICLLILIFIFITIYNKKITKQ